jgi:hypothetical protein
MVHQLYYHQVVEKHLAFDQANLMQGQLLHLPVTYQQRVKFLNIKVFIQQHIQA